MNNDLTVARVLVTYSLINGTANLHDLYADCDHTMPSQLVANFLFIVGGKKKINATCRHFHPTVSESGFASLAAV